MQKAHYATIVFALVATLCQATAASIPGPGGSVVSSVGALCSEPLPLHLVPLSPAL